MNKIIKIYRNYHKRKELSTITSTPNNTDRLQETNSIANLINSPKNNINSVNNDNMKSHSIIQKKK